MPGLPLDPSVRRDRKPATPADLDRLARELPLAFRRDGLEHHRKPSAKRRERVHMRERQTRVVGDGHQDPPARAVNLATMPDSADRHSKADVGGRSRGPGTNSAFLERAAALADDELNEAPAGDAVPAAEAAELLGGAAALGQTVRDMSDLARAVHAGLPVVALDGLRRAGFTGPELESLVAPARTLARRRGEGRLTVEESAAVERAARMLVLAERVLGSREAALHWLRHPMRTRLGGAAPLEWLHSDIGARVVEEILTQAEYGLTA